MRVSVWGLVLALAAAILMAGCGDDDGGDNASAKRAASDLARVVDSVAQLGAAAPTVAGHTRMLGRAQGALEAGNYLGARSLLGVAVIHARRQMESGILGVEQAEALRTALLYVLAKVPGAELEGYGATNLTKSDFEQALLAIETPRNVSRVNTQGPLFDMSGVFKTAQTDASESDCSSSQTAQTVSADIGIVITSLLQEIPEVGWLVSGLVQILWPAQDDTWCVIEAAVEELIDEKIDALVKTQVDDDLKGLNNVLNDYLNASDPAKGNTGTYISEKFNVAEGAFELYEPNFQAPGYELLLLTDFVQMANLYLALLRDGILYGESWGWAPTAVEDLKTKMTQLTDSYVSYTNYWYQQGLDNVEIPTTGDHLNVRQFNAKNQYIRQMTLIVLDYVAMWPYMNPANYPDPVTVKLTREIYSDAQGTSDDSKFVVDTSLKLELTHLTMWGWDRVDAMRVAYGGVLGPRMGDSSGGSSSPPNGIDTAVGTGSKHGALTVAYGLSGDILNAAGFTFADGYDTGMLAGQYPGGNYYTYSFDDEIVSSIKIMGISNYYGSADCIVYGFRYADSY